VPRHTARLSLGAALVAIAFVLNVEPGGAHKPITSPYSYNDDIFPILRDRCGRCHVSGGVAPMSLMTHAAAVPLGESIRTDKSVVLKLAQINPLNIEVIAPAELFGTVRVGSTGSVNLAPFFPGTYAAKVVVVKQLMNTTWLILNI